MKILIFLAAIITLTFAHGCKILRWRLFVEIYEKPYDRNLVQSLSMGYFINFFLPYKVGDFFRGCYAGRKMKNGYSFSFSTIIVDRYLDVIAVGFLFTLFYISGFTTDEVEEAVRFYIIISLGLMGLTIFAYSCSRQIKRILRTFAAIFNEEIEFRIFKFSWSLIWNFKDIFLKINKFKILLTTLSMWGLYLLSYYLFSLSLSMATGNSFKLVDIFVLLFSKNSFNLGTGGLSHLETDMSNISWLMAYYLLVPLFVLLFISLFVHIKFLDKKDEERKAKYLNLLPHLDKKERLFFLDKYFAGNQSEYLENYLKINQGISIIRDYSAGSNATTMLCMTEESTFFRKYAFDEDGMKLFHQIEWIKRHKDALPLTEIIRYESNDDYCFYDMPYKVNAVPLFHFVHSMPWEEGWKIIEKVLDCLETSVYTYNKRPADLLCVKEYISKKLDNNLEKIMKCKQIKELAEYKEIIINGRAYKNLTYYLMGNTAILNHTNLTNIFIQDSYAEIHGDLTMENIICLIDGWTNNNYYIIDPNTGNIHDSPNLDYAKLLQSIHGGYEFLMTTDKITVEKNRINFMFTKSSAYSNLYKKMKEYMNLNFNMQRIKSIYFHEMIHWMRLMPYKIEKDTERVLIFYAGLLMVLDDINTMFGE